jgi:acetolactate decarboxylase
MLVTLAVFVSATVLAAFKEGLVEFSGAQKAIFATGKADRVLTLNSLADRKGLFAVGPVEGLDGEITIFDSKPYITKVRGADFVVDHTLNHGAIFLVWTEAAAWRDVPVPDAITSYTDLQRFVKAQATSAGIDVTKPFPFLLTGTPLTVKWHINVDKSDGKPITQELFAKSKAGYVLTGESADIIGFFSENHHGIFISQLAPAIKPDTGLKNALHLHFVSRASKASGHIDDLTLGPNTVLRLPKL